jgi:hypothetical protein
MEIQLAAVHHRLEELRHVAASLRAERRARRRPMTAVRIALGRRLVALGAALLDGTGARVPAASR